MMKRIDLESVNKHDAPGVDPKIQDLRGTTVQTSNEFARARLGLELGHAGETAAETHHARHLADETALATGSALIREGNSRRSSTRK